MAQKQAQPNDWETVDDWENISPESTDSKPKSSWMSNAWETANKPMWNAPSEFAESVNKATVSPDLFNERMNRTIPGLGTGIAMAQGFGQGALQGIGDVISGFTSPLNVATTLATLGSGTAAKMGAGTTARGLGMVGRGLSAPVAVHGGMQVLNPETSLSEKGFGLAEMAGGAAGMKYHAPVASTSGLKKTGQSIIDPNRPAYEPKWGDVGGEWGILPKAVEKGDIFRTDPTKAAPIGTQVNPLAVKAAEIESVPSKPSVVTVKSPTKELVAQLKSEGYEPAGVSKEGYAIMKRPEELAPAKTPEDLQLDEMTTQMEGELQPGMEMINDEGEIQSTTENNASGESAASQEAMNRQFSMQGKDEQFVVYDRAGNKKPLIGPEAVDYKAQPGETYGVENADGTFKTLDNQGGKLPSSVKYAPPDKTYNPSEFNQAQKARRLSQSRVGKLSPDDPIIDTVSGKPLPPEEIRKTVPQHEIPKKIQDVNANADAIKMAPKEVKDGMIRQALDFNRTLLTAYDLSAPGRQGLPLIGRKEFWTSLDDMIKAWGSEKAYNTIQESIKEHPSGLFKSTINEAGKEIPSYAKKVGLELTDVLSNREEVFKSKWAEKVPGVRPSNRAYTGFLNKLRSDTFANMVEQAKIDGKDPETNLVLGKQIADFINNATGRGDLGRLEPAAKVLSDVFFAPRLMASRVHTYTQVLNPKFYTELDPMVRKEALKSLFAVAGLGGTVGELARLGGAQVNNDPTNSDYRKIKIGNTRIDPFGGFQQYPVAAIRLLSGKSTSSVSGKTTDLTAGKYGQQSRASVAENFLTNKLAPLPSFIFAWMKGKEFDGMPFDAKNALAQRITPIVMQDIADLARENPNLIPLSILPILGVGMQTYGR